MPTTTAPLATRTRDDRGDELRTRHADLAARSARISEARAALAALSDEAAARIAATYAARDEVARQLGGRGIISPEKPDQVTSISSRTGWTFVGPHGHWLPGTPVPAAYAAAMGVVAAVLAEAAPIREATDRVSAEAAAVADELEQIRAELAHRQADADQEAAARAERARAIGARLDWAERVQQVLATLG